MTRLTDEALREKPFQNLRSQSCKACGASDTLRPRYMHQAPFPPWLSWSCQECGYQHGATGTAMSNA